MKKSYAIIGTGAIGGFIGASLAHNGFEVHCLARSDYAVIKAQGITIVRKSEKMIVPVHAYNDINDMPLCDVIVIAIKATANDILPNILPKVMHNHSIVFVAQNGIGVEQWLAKFIRPEQIVGGTCMLKITRVGPGIFEHVALNKIDLAQYYEDDKQTGMSEAAQLLSKDLAQTGAVTEVHDHLPTVRWKKLAGNIPSHGLTITLNAYLQDILNHPQSFALFQRLTEEIATVANQCGCHFPENFVEKRVALLDDFKQSGKSYSSMKYDFDAGKPLEIQVIFENPIAIAKSHNVTMPLTEMLYQQVKFLDDKRAHS